MPQARPDVQALAANETFNSVLVNNAAAAPVAGIAADNVGDGIFALANRRGLSSATRVAILVNAADAGEIIVTDSTGLDRFKLSGDGGYRAASGDVAEMFPASGEIAPGSVVVIDAQHRGAMSLSSAPYDRRVAGVVAGANEYRSAITLRAMDGALGKVPVTLTGTAYCLASNANGPIKAGDLLTTSSVPGHAMKVTDHDAARGAILGKALEDLKGDKGQILILASLQ
jgi:hypothetical protein